MYCYIRPYPYKKLVQTLNIYMLDENCFSHIQFFLKHIEMTHLPPMIVNYRWKDTDGS